MACVTPIPADPKALQTPTAQHIPGFETANRCAASTTPWRPIDQLAVKKKTQQLFTMKNPMGFKSLVLDDWAGLVYHLSSFTCC